MNHAVTKDSEGRLSIWLNLSGPDPQLGAVTITIRPDERTELIEAIASGELARNVETALRIWDAHEAAR